VSYSLDIHYEVANRWSAREVTSVGQRDALGDSWRAITLMDPLFFENCGMDCVFRPIVNANSGPS
jgi:hypothetical protein